MKAHIKFGMMIFSLIMLAACSKMNDLHEKYLKEGETVYIAKFDQLSVSSGKKRVEIRYLLSDPKAKHSVIYWNLGKDSVTRDIAITHDSVPNILKIDNLEEGNVSFDIYNYDADYKNKSIVMQLTATVYGDFYETYLANRILKNYILNRKTKELTLNWATAVYDNAVGSEIKYLTAGGRDTTVFILMEDTVIESGAAVINPVLQTKLPNYMEQSLLEYRTVYHPDPDCADVFYTDYESVAVENPAPLVTAIPSSGQIDTEIELTGTDLDLITAVWFGLDQGLIASKTYESLRVTIPTLTEAATVDVKIVYGDGKETVVMENAFQILLAPEPLIPSPPVTGQVGGTITLTGENLDLIEEVWFGAKEGTLGAQTASSLTVTIPSDAVVGTTSLISRRRSPRRAATRQGRGRREGRAAAGRGVRSNCVAPYKGSE
jgi:hypothetical protein